jgi:hypothetical protein
VLIDRSHRPWIIVTILLAALAGAAYVPYHLHGPLNGPRGSAPAGLAYGIAATAIIIFAALLGVRRMGRARALGRAETWLKGHVWLGLLAYLLVFLHAGFRVGGALTLALLLLYTGVVVSGIYGLVVQHIVPRLLTAQLPHETLHDQAPLYIERLRDEAARAVTQVCGAPAEPVAATAVAGAKPARRSEPAPDPVEGSQPLRDFYTAELEPFLRDGRGRLAAPQSRRAIFAHVRALCGAGVHATLEGLEELCEERRRVRLQVRLHGWLHGWLLVHVPLAAALVVLTIVHAVASLYY